MEVLCSGKQKLDSININLLILSPTGDAIIIRNMNNDGDIAKEFETDIILQGTYHLNDISIGYRIYEKLHINLQSYQE